MPPSPRAPCARAEVNARLRSSSHCPVSFTILAGDNPAVSLRRLHADPFERVRLLARARFGDTPAGGGRIVASVAQIRLERVIADSGASRCAQLVAAAAG